MVEDDFDIKKKVEQVLEESGFSEQRAAKMDVDDLLKGQDPLTIEEVHMGGNTFGVEASKALADFLSKAVNIKVRYFAEYKASSI